MKTTDKVGIILILVVTLIFAPWILSHFLTYLLFLVVVLGAGHLIENRKKKTESLKIHASAVQKERGLPRIDEPRKARGSTPQRERPLSYVDCEVTGCEEKKIPYPMYFHCNYCGSYFCAVHRLPFNHQCPGIQKWREEPPLPSGTVIGVIRNGEGELKHITNYPERGFPHGEKKDEDNKLPGYE